MACKTSFFNPTLYKKTLHRFWPLWVTYAVAWLFAIPLNLLNQYLDARRWVTSVYDAQEQLLDICYDLMESVQPCVWLAAGVGLVAAMAVFGYLYGNRSAALMHQLPLRREALFVTQYLAGASMFLLPHLLAGGLGGVTLVVLTTGQITADSLSALLTWLLAQSGTTLFFYSFAVFCAMFTGHILALPAFYGILNALVVAIYSLMSELMTLFFYGYRPNYDYDGLVEYLTPVYALTEACDRERIRAELPNTDGIYETIGYYLESPGTILAYVVAGFVLTALALLVYRRRHIESAGDVVSVAIVRPIFQVGVAFCVGLFFGTLTTAFFGWTRNAPLFILCTLIWTVVGWFAAAMLLKKSFRVFRGGWKGCLVMLCVMAMLCAACALDWFGIENRVPKAGEVVSLSTRLPDSAPYDTANWNELILTDPAHIQMYIDLHHAIIREKDRAPSGWNNYRPSDAESYTSIYFTYELADGSRLQRRYSSVALFRDELEEEGSASWCFNRVLQDRDLVGQAYGIDRFADARPTSANLSPVRDPYGRMSDAEIEDDNDQIALWLAVLADFDAGDLGRRWLFEDEERWTQTYESDLHFAFRAVDENGGDYTTHITITLTPSAKRTLAMLEELDILSDSTQLVPHDGYEPAKYPETIVSSELVICD